MTRTHSLIVASASLVLIAAAAAPAAAQNFVPAGTPGAKLTPRPTRSYYGPAAKVGAGEARVYVTYDEDGTTPLEIGVALSERALEDLPMDGAGHHGAHGPVHQWLLDLPAEYTAPFTFLELNWNPKGHEPDGVYRDVPHFDFHFYTISRAERERIVPSNPEWAAKANDLPSGDYVPPFNVPLGPPGAKPEGFAVPLMGVHWSDLRSAELQRLLGKPEGFKPFTATFIHGSWGGRYIFWEPMITRAHILAKKTTSDPAVRDEVIPISTPARYHVPGSYPDAYRITWDAEAKEYRIALTGLTRKQ